MTPLRNLVATFCASALLAASSANAQGVTLVKAFPGLTFFQPVLLTHPPDGTNRIFVVQQNGVILVFPNDSSVTSTKTFLTITGKLSAYDTEEGLLGLAFDPQFSTNGYFYIDYTAPNPLRTVIARYRVKQGNPDVADTSSAFIILEILQPPATNHKGGNLAFGPDEYLYAGTGDGGGANDQFHNAQDRKSLLGKMLRIDVKDTTATTHYKIPPDNPLVHDTTGLKKELWTWGMRNPWRWSFDQQTGVLWCGDVGQDTWEEIDIIQGGKNYGWPIMEGFACNPIAPNCDSTGFTPPIWMYGHDLGHAVVGGYVYRGSRVPWLTGAYIYGDEGSGRIWMMRYSNGVVTADSVISLGTGSDMSSFGIDEHNELYMVMYGATASIYQFKRQPTAGVSAAEATLRRFALHQNYPNPFNPTTVIAYEVPAAGRVTLNVFNLLGQNVATLVNEYQPAGAHEARFDAAGLSSGVYIYRIKTGAGSIARGMVLTR